jgi:hypothetical protein
MLRNKPPTGFIAPAQPVERAVPPSGADWVHEIKHDGYRMIVRRDGERVRLYSRKAIAIYLHARQFFASLEIWLVRSREHVFLSGGVVRVCRAFSADILYPCT